MTNSGGDTLENRENEGPFGDLFQLCALSIHTRPSTSLSFSPHLCFGCVFLSLAGISGEIHCWTKNRKSFLGY